MSRVSQNKSPRKIKLRNKRRRKTRALRERKLKEKQLDAWSGVNSSPLYRHTEQLVNAIVRQDKPYILPRPAGTYVSPHQVSFDLEYTIPAADITAGTQERVFILSTDPDQLLRVGKSGTGTMSGNENTLTFAQPVMFQAGVRYYFNHSLDVIADGSDTELHSYAYPGNGATPPSSGIYLTNVNGEVVKHIGSQIYPFSLNSITTLTLYLGSEDAGVNYTLTAGIGCIDGSGNVISEVTNTASVVSGGNGSVAITAAAGWAAYLAAQASASGSYMWISTSVDVDSKDYGAKFNAGVYTTPLEYEIHSLWDCISPSVALRAQYNGCELWNPTGLRVLFQNTTPEIALSGSVLGARLPSYAAPKVPGTPAGVAALLSSQKHHKLRENKLAKGACYVYTPEKVQDYFFERPGGTHDKPFGVCYMKPSQTNDSGCSLLISVTYSYELITVDVSATMFPSASSEILMNSLLYALSKENGWSENPNHLAHAASMVKKVMTSDEMKFALKSLISAGIKVAPMVISALM